MTRSLSLILALVGLVACGAPKSSEAPAADNVWVLEAVTLLDPVGGRSGPVDLVFREDRIDALGSGSSQNLDDVQRLDGSGLFVLPGLWDLHTHLSMSDVSAPSLLVTQGVTGVRDLGGILDEVEELRRRIHSGNILGPRMVRAGPTLNGAANGPHHRVIDSPEAAVVAVNELAELGVEVLKIHNATEREPYFALLEAAAKARLPVVGHVPTAVDPLEACAAGQRSVEHIVALFEGTYLARFEGEMEAFLAMPEWVEREAPDLAECFAEHQTLFVPTLRAYELRADWAKAYDEPDPRWRYISPAGVAKWREAAVPTEIDRRAEVIDFRRSLVDVGLTVVELLHQAGVPIGTGTDLASPGLLPGFDLHAEIRLLGRVLSPREALRAATRGPGRDSGGRDLEGRLVAGAPADLVVLRADAFEDLGALDEIEAVVLGGRWLAREALDEVLAGLEQRSSETG